MNKKKYLFDEAKVDSIPMCKNLEHMIIGAERYAFGRRTYIVSLTVDYLTSLLPKISDWCLGIMIEDIKSNFELCRRVGNYETVGDSCDINSWRRFEVALYAEQDKRKKDDEKLYKIDSN